MISRNIRSAHIRRFAMVLGIMLLRPLYGADSALERQREEERRILLVARDKVFAGTRKKGMTLVVDEVKLPVSMPATGKVFSIPKVEVRGGGMYKNGQPAYLLGAEAGMNIHPFLYKVLGMDWVQIGGPLYLNNTLRIEWKDPKTAHVFWRVPREADLAMRELAQHGLIIYAQPIMDQPKIYKILYENFGDLFVTHGHYYNFRHDNPDAWRIAENFFKSIISVVGKYPVFAYELYNEVAFSDYGPGAITRFRLRMLKKYGNIRRANQVWKTAFKSFNAVTPPQMGGGGDATFTILGKKVSRMLWLDWLKFCEQNSGEAFARTADLFRRFQPEARLTIQTHCQFFYDYGAHGVNPEIKSRVEDIYGDESSLIYHIQMPGNENVEQIKSMLRRFLWLDYLANLLPDKPQVSEETYIGGAYASIGNLPVVVDLHNDRWRFKSDNDENGVKSGYQQPDFNDSEWARISVPDMWANQGYKKTRFGWYRFSFTVPPAYANMPLFLNGKSLADFATIYVNGHMLHKTRKWNEQFGVEITPYLLKGRNMLAISIRNDYFKAGRFWGGIRGKIAINPIAAGKCIPMQYGHVRSWLWQRALHGEAGVFPSYVYSPEGYHLSIFDPQKIAYTGLRGFPQAKAEIDSLGSIVLTRKPRWQSRVALIYPLETMRNHIHKNLAEKMQGPCLSDLATWYMGLLLNGITPAVPGNERLVKGGLGVFRAIFMQGNDRVSRAAFDRVKEYVEAGGVLVLGPSSLTRDDDFNEKLDTSALLGCIRGPLPENTADTIDLSHFKLGSVRDIACKRDQSHGCAIQPQTARILARDASGAPAVIVNRVGRGKVYLVGRILPDLVMMKLLRMICAENGISPRVQVTADNELPFLERHLVGDSNRYVLCLHDWGGGRQTVTVRIMRGLPAGRYLVRNAETRAGLGVFSADSLREKGLRVELQSMTPLVLVLEHDKVTPIKLHGISDQQRTWLDYIARPAPKGIPRNRRVLIDTAHLNQFTRITMLTACKALEDEGFEVSIALGDMTGKTVKTYTDRVRMESLADYGILFIGGMRRLQKIEAEHLGTWLKAGGRLFLCGNWPRGPHGWMNNWRIFKTLKLCGLGGGVVDKKSFSDAKSCLDRQPLYPVFTNIVSTPQTAGVGKFVSRGMPLLRLEKHAPWTVLIKGNATSSHPEAPVLAIRAINKGKVVLCGDGGWLKAGMFDKGDNRRLFLNLMKWLSE